MVATKTSRNKSPLIFTPVVWCILITETGERFAYYGFRAVLVLYFTQALDYTEAQSIALFAYTTALAYLSPLLGALLADGSWGRYDTIMVFGVIYVVGLAVLTIAAALVEVADPDSDNVQLRMKRWISMTGLLLVCLGTGGIKPCVSAFGADQITLGRTYRVAAESIETEKLLAGEEATGKSVIVTRETNKTATTSNEENVRAFFAYFYFCINVGAVSSIAIIPILRGHFGFGMAFFIPTLFMMIAMGLFWSMRHHYMHQHTTNSSLGALDIADRPSLATTFRLCWWLVRKRTWPYLPAWIIRVVPSLRPGPRPVDKQNSAVSTHDHDSNDGMDTEYHNDNHIVLDQKDQQLSDASQALDVLPILALLPIFWCLYDQQSSVWTLQATRMELHGLQPEQLNVVNPVQIMVFLPLFDKCIYPWMTNHKLNIRPLRRMSYGMILAAVAFFVSGWVEAAIQRQEEAMASDSTSTMIARVNVFWQLPQITLLSVAEICVSVTGLEFAYATSPDRLKAFLMALFLLTTAVGDFLSGFLYSTIFADLNRVLVMHICGILMLGNWIVFTWVAHWWEREPGNHQGSHPLDILTVSEEEGVEFQERRII